jgi:hypothetical protein
MDRTATMSGHAPLDNSPNSAPYATAGDKVDGAAQAVHQTLDKVADRASAQVDRLSGTAHRAVNSAADAASSAAQWASGVPEQAKAAQTRFTESASVSIRARPLAAVAGALAVGYLLGRLARLTS